MDTSSRTPRRTPTRLRLYAAAGTLIAEQGFSSTTVEEIAARAGVAKGTVYYNFTDKTELFEELLRYGVEQLAAELRQAAEGATVAGAGRVAALERMLRAGLLFADRSPAVVQLYVAEQWRTNRPWQATLHDVRRELLAVFEAVLRDGLAEGEVDQEVDVPLAAANLLGTLLVTALDWRAFQPERPLRDVHSALVRLLRGSVGGHAR
ncbi:TetR/AcrR family transcriptional regulator [Streptomyces oceani]|uniref:TetR family transcriptional regulator n=1 Tax=Streptomyces oceani TaxID=1075402 RepID=A0A1E7KCH6_9ACTN|nr:TetR/AcrR family transcriptional regulator [Streptomyces oceani]OEV01656.1 TetR family transcriptional regulator [Streptomyces oceani]